MISVILDIRVLRGKFFNDLLRCTIRTIIQDKQFILPLLPFQDLLQAAGKPVVHE
jgi:hypothetical protein